jgi:hypothetical protein
MCLDYFMMQFSQIPLLLLQTPTFPKLALLSTLPLTPAYNTYNFIELEPKAPEEAART